MLCASLLVLNAASTTGGFPVMIETDGQGAVDGLPETNLLPAGTALHMTAIPEEGWLFSHWEGDVYSLEEQLDLHVQGVTEVTALFGKSLDAFDNMDCIIVGDVEIAVESRAEGPMLVGPSELSDDQEYRIRFVFTGPGTFSLQYQIDIQICDAYIDGLHDNSSYFSSYTEGEFASWTKEISGLGTHTVELRVNSGYRLNDPVACKLKDIQWEAGYVTHISSTVGGSISGLSAEPSSRLAPGTQLELTAVPEPGYEFIEWRGYAESEDPELELTVYQPIELEAVFGTNVEADEVFSHQYGYASWVKEDGVWILPDSMEPGESAYLWGSIEGPCRLKVAASAVGETASASRVSLVVPGYRSYSVGASEGEYYIPEGTQEFYIQAKADDYGHTGPVKLSTFSASYEVKLTVDGASLTVTPSLTKPYGSSVYSGWVEEGSDLSFSLGFFGDFMGWTGDLSGLEASDSYTVTGPVSATANFGVSRISINSTDWAISPAEGVAWVPSQGLDLNGDNEVVVMSGTITGPGIFSFGPRNLLDFTVTLDGEEYDNLYGRVSFRIPEGEHEMVFRMTIDPSDKNPYGVYGGSRILYKGLSYPVFYEGYMVNTATHGGGTVSQDPDGFCYPEGTVVSVSAQPLEGNSFAGWSSPEYTDAEFEYVVDDSHTTLRAQFEALDHVGGYDWTYEGVRPFYTPSDYEANGYFGYYLDYGFVGSSRCITQVEGPGLLYLSSLPSTTFIRNANFQLKVDGEVQSIPGYAYNFSKYLAEGTHTVEYAFDVTEPLNYYADLDLVLPAIRTLGTLSVYSYHASASKVPDQDEYTLGESVQISAPEFDDEGNEFYGWYDSDQQEFVSHQHEDSIVVSGDMRLRAIYAMTDISIPGVSVCGVSSNASMYAVNSERTPDNEEAYQVSKNSTLYFIAENDTVLSFQAKVEVGSSLELRKTEWGSVYSKTFLPWAPFSIYLRAGERLEMRTGYSNHVYLGEFSTKPGWGPTLFACSLEDLQFSPALDAAVDGSPIKVDVVEERQSEFFGWVIPQAEDSWSTPSFIMGAKVILQPDLIGFSSYLEGMECVSQRSGWRPTLVVDGDEVAVNFNSDAMYREIDDPGEHRLAFEVNGFGDVSFNFYFDGQDENNAYEVLLDGEPVKVWDGAHVSLFIPQGDHLLEFIHRFKEDGSRMDVWGLRYNSGIWVEDMDSSVGGVNYVGNDRYFQEGDELDIYAYARNGYVFAGWEAPFAGYPSSFRFVLDERLLPVPIFETEKVEFSMQGFDWKAELVDVSQRDEMETIDRKPYSFTFTDIKTLDSGAHMETQVSGPAVLILSDSFDWDESRLDAASIMGESVFAYECLGNPITGEDETLLLAIPSGEHRLDLALKYGVYDTLLEPCMTYVPGCLVVVKVLGGEVSNSADGFIVEQGYEMTLSEASTSAGGYTEWHGLPADAMIAGVSRSFTVEDHLDIEVDFWRPLKLFGIDMMHAGDGLWVKSGSSYYDLSWNEEQDGDKLRWDADRLGVLHYDMTIAPGSDLHINGEMVNTFEYSETLDDSYRVQNIGDRMEWGPMSGSDHGGGASRIFSLAYGPESDYDAWWRSVDSIRTPSNKRMDPAGDNDQDGIPNYVEFLNGTDPLTASGGVRLAFVRWNGQTYLRCPEIPETLTDSYVLEYAESLTGSWRNAEEILGDSIDSDVLAGAVLREFLGVLSESKSCFFRYRYTETIPSLKEMRQE